MKSTFRILFYLKRDKEKVDGTVPVWCRITVDGQATRFNTKVSINPNAWDSKAAKAAGKTKVAMEINALLDTIKASIYKVYHDLRIGVEIAYYTVNLDNLIDIAGNDTVIVSFLCQILIIGKG